MPEPRLLTDAIDVWHLELTADRADWEVLTDDERRRAERFRVADKQVQFVAGRAQLREILAGYLGRPPDTIHFEYGDHGKPSLGPGLGDLAFNLSHSHDRGLLAVARGAGLRLGVDIELARPGRRFTGIAERFFAAPESQDLLELPVAEQPAAFYRAWTRKEAYLKAWGSGLSFPSNRFCLTYERRGASRLLSSAMPGEDQATLDDWQLPSIAVGSRFSAALCYPGPRRWLRHFVSV